jgi:spore coat polysaccharide biosynthesis protein SpsF (cytidylyltransferase family)
METHLRVLPDLTSTRQVMEDCSVKRYVPKGLSVDILNCNTLLSVDQSALNDYEKECVIPVFFLQKYNVNIIRNYDIDLPELSVDTPEDHERVSAFAKNLLMNGELLNILGYK